MTEELPGGWTLQKLKVKSIEDRYTVWLTARRKGTPDAQRLVDFIEACGLEFAPAGLPAVAGVAPLVVAAMGDRYGAFSQMMMTSGFLVAEVKRAAGYEIDGRRQMPPGSVAQTAAY